MVNRRVVPTSAIAVSEEKMNRGNVSIVVPVGGGSEVFLKKDGAGRAGAGGYVVVRGVHVKHGHKLGTKAKAMKACAGKHGHEFGACLTSKGIRAPRSLGGEGAAKAE